MELPELSEVDILSARLRVELDGALGHETPEIIREAAQRYSILEEPELADNTAPVREPELGRPEPEPKLEPQPAQPEPEIDADREASQVERDLDPEPEPDFFDRDPFDTTRRIGPERYYAEPEGRDRDIGDREPGD